ncbi:MAG: SRPBCC domain-containing protein [Verrucomicrobiota bacterium]
MTAKPAPVVRVTRRFSASAERVFAAWLDPVRAARWLFATESGTMIRTEMDARVGGKWNVTERRGDQVAEHAGEYLVIDRPRRLVFTFGMPTVSPEVDRVTVEIVPNGAGCELTLTHQMRPEWADYRDQTEGGWTTIVEGLARSLDEPPFNELPVRAIAPGEIRLERLLPGPIERVWAYLTEPEKRRKWLADGPMELRVGGKVELCFKHSDLAGSAGTEPPAKYAQLKDGFKHPCRITRLEPPHLLAYSWGSEDPDPSEVTFELTPSGKKDVKLTIVHRRITDRGEKISTAAGWHAHVTTLIAELEGTPPQSFWPHHTALEARYDRELTSP